MEGLSTLINKAVAQGNIHGIQICRGAPMMSQLFFADDWFLFCRANIFEANHIMGILRLYAEASRQEINMNKSEVFFSTRGFVKNLGGLSCVRNGYIFGTSVYGWKEQKGDFFLHQGSCMEEN
ncbi:hypothetical protein QL285_051992 [Trifolium repens]|nr:hypothetical protein QL285_051992 [Trifolium repens]